MQNIFLPQAGDRPKIPKFTKESRDRIREFQDMTPNQRVYETIKSQRPDLIFSRELHEPQNKTSPEYQPSTHGTIGFNMDELLGIEKELPVFFFNPQEARRFESDVFSIFKDTTPEEESFLERFMGSARVSVRESTANIADALPGLMSKSINQFFDGLRAGDEFHVNMTRNFYGEEDAEKLQQDIRGGLIKNWIDDFELKLTHQAREGMTAFADSTRLKFEEWIEDNQELLGRHPELQTEREKVATFLGGLAGNTVTGLAAGYVGFKLGGLKGASLAGYAYSHTQYGGRVYREAIDAGLTREQAEEVSAYVGFLTGVAGMLPMGRLFSKIPGGDRVTSNLVSNIGREMIKQGLLSGSTEIFQEGIVNAFANTYYEDRDLFEGLELAFLGGFIQGGVTGAGRGLVVSHNQMKIDHADSQKMQMQAMINYLVDEGEIGEAIYRGIREVPGLEIGDSVLYYTEQGETVFKPSADEVAIGSFVEIDGKKIDYSVMRRISELKKETIGSGDFIQPLDKKVRGIKYDKSPLEGINYNGPTQTDAKPVESSLQASEEKNILRRASRWLQNKVSISQRFGAIAPETAESMRRATSMIISRQETYFDKMYKFHRLGLTSEQYQEAILLAQRPDTVVDPQMKRAASLARDILDTAKNDTIKRGWLQKGFQERILSEFQDDRSDLVNRRNAKKYGKGYAFSSLAEINEAISELDRKINKIENTQYVPIPIRMMAEHFVEQNPHKRSKYYSESILKKRDTFLSMEDYVNALKEDGVLDVDLDVRKILGAYWQQYSKMTVIDDLFSVGQRDGFVVKSIDDIPEHARKNWTRINRKYGPWEGQYAHNMFLDSLESQLGLNNKSSGLVNAVRSSFSTIKFFAFYNPAIMGTYNMIQSGISGALFSRTVVPRFSKAWDAVKNRTEDYYKMQELAGISSPFPGYTFDAFMNEVSREISKNDYSIGQRLAMKLSPIATERGAKGKIGAGFQLLRDIYGITYNMTWKMDAVIRMQTWYGLIEQGFDKSEAAKKTALYHADYGDIPGETRRFLNMILFTPSFDISMGKMYAGMIDGVGAAMKGDASKGQWNDARALGLMTSMWLTRDFIFTKLLGYERDQLFRRYYKDVEDEEGNPRELVFTMAGPDLKLWSYFHRFKPESHETDYISYFLSQMKYELHPVYRLGLEISANEREDFQPIYNNLDPLHLQARDIALYSAQRIVRMFELISKESPQRMSEANEIAREELGSIVSNLIKPFTFRYTRSTENRRKAWQMINLKNQLQEDLRRLDSETQREEMNVLINRYKELIDDIRGDNEFHNPIPYEQEKEINDEFKFKKQ